MKLLFLIRSLNYGGAERQLVELARGLHSRGHDIAVASFYGNGPLEKDLRKAGVRVISLDKKRRWDVLPFLGRLVKTVRAERPDVLHGCLPVPNLLAILIKPLFPGMRTTWGIAASNLEPTQNDWLSHLIFKIESFFSRFADIIIVNSQAGYLHHLQQKFPEKKMVVIPNGIDTVRFRPDPQAGRILRARWGIKEGQPLIGIMARLDPIKDHATFLKAAVVAAKKREDIRFVCIGGGDEAYAAGLKRLAKELGLDKRLTWAGMLKDDEMPAAYNALDIHTLSSISEGLANVLGEAMSCGVPCVATDAGDAATIIDDTGKIVPISNPDALAKAWLDMLSSDMKQAGTNARKRIMEDFSLERLFTATEKILGNLATQD